MITDVNTLEKEIKTAWLFAGDVCIPLFRKLFCTTKSNYNWFKKNLIERMIKTKVIDQNLVKKYYENNNTNSAL